MECTANGTGNISHRKEGRRLPLNLFAGVCKQISRRRIRLKKPRPKRGLNGARGDPVRASECVIFELLLRTHPIR